MPQKPAQNAPRPFDWAWLDWPDIRAMLAAQHPRIVLTIGYGNAAAPERLDSPAVLRGIAEGFGATKIVDCRAQPGGARIRAGWSQGLVKEALDGGPEYQWKGDVLGGKDRHRGRGCTPEGLKWVDAAARESTVMLLCACAERHTCHLHRLVATDLLDPEKRASMGLSGPAPVFIHLFLDGAFVDGETMLAATDENLPFRTLNLPATAERAVTAGKWRDAYAGGKPTTDE